jgi:hypothetical protein
VGAFVFRVNTVDRLYLQELLPQEEAAED